MSESGAKFPGVIARWSPDGSIKFRLPDGEYEYLVDGGWLQIVMRDLKFSPGKLFVAVKDRATMWRKNGGEWNERAK